MREITATIDALDLKFALDMVAGAVSPFSGIDSNRHLTFRRTIEIVATEDATMLGHVFRATADVFYIVGKGCGSSSITDSHLNVAINHSSNSW